MNIFYLHSDPKICAAMHADKHCVKMILEYAQLLSTAHRVLDGVESQGMTATGRSQKVWTLEDSTLENALYKATHVNHPSAVWTRKSFDNYVWLHHLLTYLCKEYTLRYGKVHKVQSSGLLRTLADAPEALEVTKYIEFTQPTPAMPDEYIVPGDSIQSYRNYYVGAKKAFAKWKASPIPEWFTAMLHSNSITGVNYANI